MKLIDKEKLADILIKLEIELNSITYKDIPVGGLLSLYHNQYCYNGLKEPGLYRSLIILLKLLGSIFSKKPKSYFNNKKVLISRVGSTYHLKRLTDQVHKKLHPISFLLHPESKYLENKFHRKISIKMIYPICRFLFYQFRALRIIYRKNEVRVSGPSLMVFLIAQLISSENWIKVLSNSTVKLVVVDFDRHDLNAPLVLVAKTFMIKTVSLVHGVINPPYGFYPLLANEIWVWGDYQKNQMIDFGLDESRIQVVGNPIAESHPKKHVKNKQIKIGVALNPIKNTENMTALNHFLCTEALDFPFQWIVKLHPSMEKTKEYLNFSSEKVSIIDKNDLSNEQFFQKIDALILGNSGIGLEALINNIPLLVYRLSNDSSGHDSVMIDEGKCPEINNSTDYLNILNQMDKDSFRKQLLNGQKSFLNKFYYKIGADASNKISNTIMNVLS